MPGRNYSAGYRFGYNGKEKDNEIAGDGNELDFGARIYDPRVGRWLATDPKAGKHPLESSYIFCSSNPIIYVDPDGKEKIVVIGGGDNTAKDKYKFVNSGLRQMLDYAKSNSGKSEPITIIVTDKFVDAQTYEALNTWAIATELNYDVKINVVKVQSGSEITNYINSKSTTQASLSAERQGDPISTAAVFAHGYSPAHSSQGDVGSVEPGHGTPGEDISDPPAARPEHNRWAWGEDEVHKVNSKAFIDNANCDFYSCNAGTPNKNGESLVGEFSKQVPQAKISGYWGRTDYAKIYSSVLNFLKRIAGQSIVPASNLPVGGTKSGGANGSGTSEKVIYQNGKNITTN